MQDVSKCQSLMQTSPLCKMQNTAEQRPIGCSTATLRQLLSTQHQHVRGMCRQNVEHHRGMPRESRIAHESWRASSSMQCHSGVPEAQALRAPRSSFRRSCLSGPVRLRHEGCRQGRPSQRSAASCSGMPLRSTYWPADRRLRRWPWGWRCHQRRPQRRASLRRLPGQIGSGR